MQLTDIVLDEFLKWLAYELDIKPNTIKTYYKGVVYLRKYLQDKPFTFENCKEYIIYLKQTNKEPATINRYRLSIGVFIQFLQSKDPSYEDFYRRLPVVKRKEKPLEVLTLEEIDSIINCKRDYKYLELQLFWDTLLGLMARTGRRVGEISKLRYSDIDIARKVILIRDPKNNQPRWIPAPVDLLKQTEYLRRDSEYVFTHRFTNGQPVSTVSVRNEVKLRAKLVGITRRVHPHLFRHSFPIEILRKKVDVVFVQRLMGHKKLDSTLRYIHMVLDDLQIASNQHPLNQAELTVKDIVEALEKEVNRYSLQDRDDLTFRISHKPKEFKFSVKWNN